MQDAGLARPGRLLLLRKMLQSPIPIISFILSSAIYYLLITYLIKISSMGVVVITAPIYFLYALSITSGLLLTASIYSIYLSSRYRIVGFEDGVISAITTLLGGIVASCACSAPILSVILYDLGIDVFGVSDALSFVSSYQNEFLGIAVIINLLLLYYSLGKVSSGCRIRKGKIIVKKDRK